LGRNYLKGRVGDTNHALLAGMGFNLMLLLRELAGNFWAPYPLGPLRAKTQGTSAPCATFTAPGMCYEDSTIYVTTPFCIYQSNVSLFIFSFTSEFDSLRRK
ncbi:MAG: hypothetical protein MUC61_00720, partial [Amoebophilaceae bacterium]|nr:hypothetical protein [Amoebophilaceae bacterium]